ncbi:MAG: hypothetical protein GY736_05210 [Sphingomonas sp.]|uniref:hypothetical protein n=1 Tax=Sphingomonas sp. TaxID=28214 RepID=UPI0025907062|nr:hypothetical protein [Sphingomonas sp.]MCP4025697.1 hypothetical protein [Sphingomonas sp.]
MPHPHIPSREQADASLDRFYKHLGHQPLSKRFDRMPRLAGRPVHADLGATIDRLRRSNPIAAVQRSASPAKLRYRLFRRRVINGTNRLLDAGTTAAVIGIGGWVVAPAVLTIIVGKL